MDAHRFGHAKHGKGTGHAEDVLRDILAQAKEREHSVFSQKTYTGEPLLKTGKDFKASRTRAMQKHRHGGEAALETAQARNPSSPHNSQSRGSSRTSMAYANASAGASHRPADETGNAPHPHSGSWARPRLNLEYQQQARSHASLPPLLQELRALEGPRRFPYARPMNTQIFIRQAQMAAAFVDNAPYPRKVGFHRQATYADLNDDELRGYFTWRGAWLSGEASVVPATYARIRAAEIANGIRTDSPADGLAELEALLTESRRSDASAIGVNLQANLSRWVHDYILVFGLDTNALVSEEERQFAHAVMTLRTAEEAIRARMEPKPHDGEPPGGGDTKLDIEGDEKKAEHSAAFPSIAEVWGALRSLSSPDPAKSPFLRTHEKEAAAVSLLVFAELVRYCREHGSLTLVDSLVGRKKSHSFTPFLGLPWDASAMQKDALIPLCDGYSVTCRNGQWAWQRAWNEAKRNKELGGIIRGIDRQMRIDWQEGKALKERPLPPFLTETIAWASASVRNQERAAAQSAAEERTRLSIDLSKLAAIRSDAAHTREALLVDEERDEPQPTLASQASSGAAGYAAGMEATVTGGAKASATDDAPAKQQGNAPVLPPANTASMPLSAPAYQAETAPSQRKGSTPASSNADSPEEATLSPLERQALERMAQGQSLAMLLANAMLMESVLVDAINEKLFDAIGDVAIEYRDGSPRLIEDYRPDIIAILNEGV